MHVILLNAEPAEASTCFVKVQNILKHTQTTSDQFSALDVNLVRS